jgi:hypothetical protein
MKYLKIVVIFIILLIVIFLGDLFFNSDKGDAPSIHQALKISVLQDENYQLRLNDVSIADTYPSNLKLDLDSNYYSINLYGEKDDLLFEGKVANSTRMYTESFVNSSLKSIEEGSVSAKIILPEITVFLPLYKKAVKVNFLNEQKVVKLSVDLTKYPLKFNSQKENLCGNGICDTNENFINCFKDCRVQLSEFFKKAAP